MRNPLSLLLLLSIALMIGSGCATVPETIDDDLTAEELFRLAQDAYNNTQYRLSLAYYDTIIERFSEERVVRISAEYEVAYINFKLNNEEEATAQFADLLAEYQTNSIGFPRWVYVLSKDIYDQIVE